MLTLRILRNLAVLVILAVAVLTSPPRSAASYFFHVFHGYCQAGLGNNSLTGNCVTGNFVPGLCRVTSDSRQCPPGATTINPTFISFGICSQRVDTARLCAVNYP
jgi:hypothetical protein